jgi:hypothetical protein
MAAENKVNWFVVRAVEAVGIGLGALALIVALRELPSAGRYLGITRMAKRRDPARAVRRARREDGPPDAQAPRRAKGHPQPQRRTMPRVSQHA